MPPAAKVDLDLFNLDTLIAENTREPFRFTLEGNVRELPHFGTLSPKQALRLDAGEIQEVLGEIADEKLADQIMSLPGFAADALLKKWMGHAGSEPGE